MDNVGVLIGVLILIAFFSFIIKKHKSVKKKLNILKENRKNNKYNFKNSIPFSDNKSVTEYSEPETKIGEFNNHLEELNNGTKQSSIISSESFTNEALKNNFIDSSDFHNILIKQKQLYELNILSFTEFTAFKKDYINSKRDNKLIESKEDFLLGISSLVKEGILSTEELSEIKTIISKNLI